jgi:hypothetical protein
MYPTRELKRLARRKLTISGRIAVHREECAGHLAGVVRPLVWLDRARFRWQKVPPLAKLAAIPLFLLVKRALFPKTGVFRSLLSWTPFILSRLRTSR